MDTRTRRRFITIAIIALGILSLGWIAWPYYALYDLMVAFRDSDIPALESRVAWDSVRQGLRDDLNAAFAQKSGSQGQDAPKDALSGLLGPGLAALLGPTIINSAIDSYVTPQAIAGFVRTGKLLPVAQQTTTTTDKGQGFNWRQVKYAFFSGSPFTFKLEVLPDNAQFEGPVSLLLHWSGNWKLTRIFFPVEAINTLPIGPPFR